MMKMMTSREDRATITAMMGMSPDSSVWETEERTHVERKDQIKQRALLIFNHMSLSNIKQNIGL